ILIAHPDFSAAALALSQMDVDDGKPDEAERRLKDVVERTPGNVPALMRLANLAFAGDRAAEGMSWLEKAVAADGNALDAKIALAQHVLTAGQVERGMGLARELFEKAPSDPAVLETMAAAQELSGQNAAAAATLKQLVALRPNAAQPQARLGRLLIGLGQLREARAALEASRRADPSLLAPTLSLARLAQQEGSLAEARGLYQSMLSN